MELARFVARRLVFAALTLFIVSLLVFALTHLLGDPAVAALGPDASQPLVLAATRAELGLDRPLAAQYGSWLAGVLSGDLGTSYLSGRPIGEDLGSRMQNSLVLMAAGAVLALPISLVVGVRAARRRDGRFDQVANGTALVLAAVPEFVVATGLVVVFSVGVFEVLPAVSSVRGATRPWNDIQGMILPSITLALVAVPYVMRSTRASMIEVLDSEYVEMARLNGLPERSVLWGQALPNAIGPTIQVVALSLAFMASGIVVVEQVFNYPGIGTALVDAIARHDVPVVQAIALGIAVLYVAFNALADIAAVVVTPRLRRRLS